MHYLPENCEHEDIRGDQCFDCGICFPPEPSDISVREVILILCLIVAFLIAFVVLMVSAQKTEPNNNVCIEGGPLSECS